MLGKFRKPSTRTLSFLLIAGLLLLLGLPAKDWYFCADDLRFFRVYTTFDSGTGIGTGLHVRWGSIFQDFLSTWKGNPYFQFYRPVVSLSLGLDFSLFGAHPGFSAIINLLIHLGSSLLIYLLVEETLPSRKSALPASLFFALSPLAHENISWIVGRCGLTVLFGLLSGLFFLRAFKRGDTGLRLFLPSVLWVLLNLMTMESALAWAVFPLVCILLWKNFHPSEGSLSVQEVIRLSLPFGALGLAYLGLRVLLFENPLGTGASLLVPKGIAAFFLDYGNRLLGSIVPLDTTWIQDFVLQRVFFWLVLTPWLLGSLAPMSFHFANSRFYRRGIYILLGFWVLATTPNVHFLQLKEGLDSARALYYCLPPLALVFGLLTATSRYGKILGIAIPLILGAGLHHRLEARAEWAKITKNAIGLIDATVPNPQTSAIALLDQLGGVYGAPGIPPGDIPLALFPPLAERRIDTLSLIHFPLLHGGQPEPELSAPAWIAKACSSFFTLREVFGEPELKPISPSPFLSPKSLSPLSFQLEGGTPFPRPSLKPNIPSKAKLLLVYAGGNKNLILPWDGKRDWPPKIRRALLSWKSLGGKGSLFACFAEVRQEVNKPSTVIARSPVRFGRIK
jgi:hypothetical protein